jgi:hypothetical protein
VFQGQSGGLVIAADVCTEGCVVGIGKGGATELEWALYGIRKHDAALGPKRIEGK